MPTLYFSLCAPDSEPVIQRIVSECESFLQGTCVIGKEREEWAAQKIRDDLKQCDVLIVVIGKEATSERLAGRPIGEHVLSERIRTEIISAMNLDLLTVPLLIEDAVLPEKRNAPAALKRLLDCKPYRLRNAFWSEDLYLFLEDIRKELDFKKEVEEKLSRSAQHNFLGLADSEGKPLHPHNLGMEFSGALELRRVIESERFNLEEARRLGDRMAEKNALSALGLAYSQLKQTQRAIQYFLEQLEIVREIKDEEEECGLLASLGDAFAISGNIERAKTYYQEQLLLADSVGHRLFAGSAFNGLGFVYVKQNKIAQAIECYLKALANYREYEDHDKELELLVGIGLNYQKLGKLKEATDFLNRALETAKYLEHRREEARILVDLAEAYYQLGNMDRARVCMNRAEEVLGFLEEPWVPSLKNRLHFLRGSLNPV